MKKTIKKLDNNVIKALTTACEIAKDWDIGFEWLTHSAKYDNFPGSLLVTCVFSIDAEITLAQQDGNDKRLRKLIQQHLLKAGIKLKDSRHHVRYDSEESCLREDDGNWQKRLARLIK